MSGEWRVRATLFEADGELRLGLSAVRDGETTSDMVVVANEAEARVEANAYARLLNTTDVEWVDRRDRAA